MTVLRVLFLCFACESVLLLTSCLSVIYLWYLLVGQGAPLINLLGQAGTLSWHLVDAVSYQNVIGYFSSHYPPSVILSFHLADELLLKLLRVSAGLTSFPDCSIYSVSASGHVLLLFLGIHITILCSSFHIKELLRGSTNCGLQTNNEHEFCLLNLAVCG